MFSTEPGSLKMYLIQAMTPLCIFGGLIAAFALAARHRARAWAHRSPDQPPAPPVLLDHLAMSPGLAPLERQRNRVAFAQWTTTAISAGLPLIESLQIAATSLPNGLFRRQADQLAHRVSDGQPITEAMHIDGDWPVEWVAAIEVAEEAGEVDRTLQRLADQANQHYQELTEHYAAWLPRIVYALVALFLIYQIFSLWSQVLGRYG